MTDDETYLRNWYINALAPLRHNGDAGFIFAFVSLPLLERYLREKSGAGEARILPQAFFDELRALFPEIPERRMTCGIVIGMVFCTKQRFPKKRFGEALLS